MIKVHGLNIDSELGQCLVDRQRTEKLVTKSLRRYSNSLSPKTALDLSKVERGITKTVRIALSKSNPKIAPLTQTILIWNMNEHQQSVNVCVCFNRPFACLSVSTLKALQ